MSTLSGIMLGVVMAAVVTVYYGDVLNRLLPERSTPVPQPPQASIVETTAAIAALPVEQAGPEPAVLASTNTTDVPGEADVDAIHLAQRWQNYAQHAGEWQPAGEFQWRECFLRAAATHGVPESLLLAVASGESGFDPAARSGKDAAGLMQIQWPGTSRHLGINREADLYDPCTNVAAGARYLAELTERYSSDLYRAVAAYNYGPGRIDDGPLPQGAHWYSQYIYQHLQRVLGREGETVGVARPRRNDGSGYEVLLSFNHHYRARDFLAFLQSQTPELELAQRSDLLGRHEVVLLYANQAERQRGLRTIQRTGLLAFAPQHQTQQQENSHVF